MKKFLVPCIFFLLALHPLAAQNSFSNFLSVHAGPNYFSPIKQSRTASTKNEGGWGYTVGLEYARKMTKHLRCQVGVRYNLWHSTVSTGPLQFPSEWVNGQYVYDPTLNHYFNTAYADKALQVTAGAGWYSSPKKWQWNIGVEAGNTMIQAAGALEGNNHHFTAGAFAGTSVRIFPRFQCFVQPAVQRIFIKSPGSPYMAMRVETGLRYHF